MDEAPAPARGTPDNHERFSEAVSNLLMAVEELHRSLHVVTGGAKKDDDSSSESSVILSLTVAHLLDWQHALEYVLQCLETLAKWTDDSGGAVVEEALFQNGQHKAVAVAQYVLDVCFSSFVEPSTEELTEVNARPEEYRRNAQGAIARITELNLLMYHMRLVAVREERRSRENPLELDESISSSEGIVESYISYQRKVLRLRARPAIAELVEARKEGMIVTPTHPPVSAIADLNVQVHNDHGDGAIDEDDSPPLPTMTQFHAPVLTLLLSEAAALLHPLLMWGASLPPPYEQEPPLLAAIRKLCHGSIQVLDEQTQTLVKTVSDWFWIDRPIDEWIGKSADVDTPPVNDPRQKQHDLAVLDGLVEEMAFCCQVQARYQSLLVEFQPTANNGRSASLLATQLLPEWTWKYATLERYLVLQHWQAALSHASPVRIVLGADVQVPSVVEDAHYLSSKALERATQTRSLQAVGTVAHAVSRDVWSMEEGVKGVKMALRERRGCWSESKGGTTSTPEVNGGPDSGGEKAFANALLDALDEDETTAMKKNMSSAASPSSGGFLVSMVAAAAAGDERYQQMQLDTQFCALNGIHAAAGACQALVTFLDTLLQEPDPAEPALFLTASDNEKSSSMVHLAREELHRFVGQYQAMLLELSEEAVKKWCGTGSDRTKLMLDQFSAFLQTEDYHVESAAAFSALEQEERLEKELLGPLNLGLFVRELPLKCDQEVIGCIGEVLSSMLASIFVDRLWSSETKVTEFGSILLSKEVRVTQAFISQLSSYAAEKGTNGLSMSVPSRASTPTPWEVLAEIVAVLQLEKPSDWLLYYSSSILSPDELRRTLSLRVGFSSDAIQSVVSQVRQRIQSPSKK